VPTEVTNLIPHDDCGFRRNQSLVSFAAAMSLAVPANAAMSSTAGGRKPRPNPASIERPI
jgi:hypothetical protein